MTHIEVLEYILPDYLACYLINGDIEGTTAQERSEVDAFIKKEQVAIVSKEDDSEYCPFNNLNKIACDCSTYIAHKVTN